MDVADVGARGGEVRVAALELGREAGQVERRGEHLDRPPASRGHASRGRSQVEFDAVALGVIEGESASLTPWSEAPLRRAPPAATRRSAAASAARVGKRIAVW